MYGAWDAIKNVEKRYPAHRLNWVAYIAGKRESRRLMGDVVLTGSDLRKGIQYEDGCVPCTWGIDTHHPHPSYSEGHEGDEFIADFTHGEEYSYDGPYWLPYRCLFSRNIDNLFMAGRDISVTHEALGAVRVMKTTGAMGEIVGMAATVCKQQNCDPRSVYEDHLDALKGLMKIGAGRPLEPGADGDWTLEARRAQIQGTQLRYESDRNCLGYWRTVTDYPGWRIKIDKPMVFDVLITSSCPANEAGAEYWFRCSNAAGEGQEIRAVVMATDSWDDYQDQSLGRISLPAGTHLLTVSSGKEEGPLMKLRRLKMLPLSE